MSATPPVTPRSLSMMSRRRARALLLTAVTALLVPNAAMADRQIGAESIPPRVAVYGGLSVWNSTSTTTSGEQMHRLVALSEGQFAPAALPIPPSPRRFLDVDLGPDEQGRPVVVYSRCTDPGTLGPSPQYDEARRPVRLPRGCDLYRFDWSTRFERRIEGASTSSASEYLPTVWGDQVAFARLYERRSGNRGRYAYLYVRDLDGGPSRRVPGGARGVLRTRAGGILGGPGPVGMDLERQRLAFTWEWWPAPDRLITELRTTRLDGTARRLHTRATSTGLDTSEPIEARQLTALTPPSLSGGYVYSALWRGDGPDGFVRYRLFDGQRTTAAPPTASWRPAYVARDRTTTVYATIGGDPGGAGPCSTADERDPQADPSSLRRCSVFVSDPLVFR